MATLETARAADAKAEALNHRQNVTESSVCLVSFCASDAKKVFGSSRIVASVCCSNFSSAAAEQSRIEFSNAHMKGSGGVLVRLCRV